MKKVNLYSVGMRHIKTGEKVNLEVWAENVDEATHKCNFLFNYNGEYHWTGSGPVYKDNQLVSKMINAD